MYTEVENFLPHDECDKLIEMINSTSISGIEQLINDGLDINATIIGDGTPLIIAVRKNKEKLVDELIYLGADINQASKFDGTPLIVAVQKNNIEIETITDGRSVISIQNIPNAIIPFPCLIEITVTMNNSKKVRVANII